MSDYAHAAWAQVVAFVLIVGLISGCTIAQSRDARLKAEANACVERAK